MGILNEFKEEWRRSEAMKRQMDQLLIMVSVEDPDRMDIKEEYGYENYYELRHQIIELLKWKKEHGGVSESTSHFMTDIPIQYP